MSLHQRSPAKSLRFSESLNRVQSVPATSNVMQSHGILFEPQIIRPVSLAVMQSKTQKPVEVVKIEKIEASSQDSQYPSKQVASKDKIFSRRPLFYFLPVMYSSDLIHGLWWIIRGSFSSFILSSILLTNEYYQMFNIFGGRKMSSLPYSLTFGLMAYTSLMVIVGSVLLMRAAIEPRLPPMTSSKSFVFLPDERVAAIFYLLSFIIPMLYFGYLLWTDLLNIYFLVIAGYLLSLTVVCSVMVSATTNSNDYLKSLILSSCCFCLPKHQNNPIKWNDWMLSLWSMFVLLVVGLAGTGLQIARALIAKNQTDTIIWIICCSHVFLSLLGVMYLIAGSHPQAGNEAAENSYCKSILSESVLTPI